MWERVSAGTRRAWLPAAGLSLAVLLSLAAIAAQGRRLGVDHSARAFVHLAAHPMLQAPRETVSILGNGAGLIPLILLGSLLLWRPRPRWALALPATIAGAGALQLLAKWAVDRPRPNLSVWGFPSGHAVGGPHGSAPGPMSLRGQT